MTYLQTLIAVMDGLLVCALLHVSGLALADAQEFTAVLLFISALALFFNALAVSGVL